MRILSYIQHKYKLSRRVIVALIKDKKISINRTNIESYTTEINPWDFYEIINWKTKIKWIYKTKKEKTILVLFNKPKWYVVSKKDEHNKSIYEMLDPEFSENLYYIGRLDKDSHGLVLLTNNTQLVNLFSHPRYNILKTYVVEINKYISQIDIQKMLDWVSNDGDILSAKEINILDNKERKLEVVLWEWKNRHIRRMFDTLWYRVIDLKRVQEWKYKLTDDIPIWKRKVIDLDIDIFAKTIETDILNK